jgi:cell division protein FtsB
MKTHADETIEPVEPAAGGAVPGPRTRVRRRVLNGIEGRQRKRKVLTYALLVFSAALMVNALVGEKGVLANMQARTDLQEASESLQRIKAENAQLTDDAWRLQHDPQALEDAARLRLGLIKPGETLVTLRDRSAARD